MKKTISIVTPCFNEEENVELCYQTIRDIFAKHLPDYEREHIFCDNASTDRTLEILKKLATDDSSVKVIVNSRNFGPLRNTYNGIMASTGDATVLFMPADMQDPPELIPEFTKLWEQGYEVIYGIRAGRSDPPLMTLMRKAYYRILAATSYVQVPPDVGDYQLVDRKVIDAMRGFDDAQPFARVLTIECGFRQVGVPYKVRPRERGFSKNRLFHLVEQGLSGLISFSTMPMRLALFSGFIIAAFSVLFAFLNVFLYFFTDHNVPRGTTLMITALFFFAGVQLFFIGFLGEYVLAIFNQVRKRPLVIERERINF
jgi:glycosyltransferase involved in cell wall biosynthesis